MLVPMNPGSALPHAKGEINRLPCVFATALTRRSAVCELAVRPTEARPATGTAPRRPLLCAQPLARAACAELDGLLREKSVFVVRRLSVQHAGKTGAPLMAIQCGGLCGLRDVLDASAPAPNVHHLLNLAQQVPGQLPALPWERIMRAIAQWTPHRPSKPDSPSRPVTPPRPDGAA